MGTSFFLHALIVGAVAGLVLGSIDANAVDPRETSKVLDAIIASGWNNEKLSWEDIVSLWQCGVEDQQQDIDNLETTIALLVNQALAKSKHDVGRILEFTKSTELPLGENYKAVINSATVVCLVTNAGSYTVPTEDSSEETRRLGTAAYASQLVGNNAAIGYKDSYESNTTMIMESDVMELGAWGMLHVPRKYCMDLEDPLDRGARYSLETNVQGSKNVYFPPSSNDVHEINRLVSFGARTSTVTTHQNRLTWMPEAKKVGSSVAARILEAFHNPKAELVALARSIENNDCPGNSTWSECFDNAVEKHNGKPDFGDLDLSAKVHVIDQYIFLVEAHQSWKAFKMANMDTEWMDILPDELRLKSMDDTLIALAYADVLAGPRKNCYHQAIQANPYYNTEEFRTKFADTQEERLDSLACVRGGVSGGAQADSAKQAALRFSASKRRRLLEHPRDLPRLRTPSDWAILNLILPSSILTEEEIGYMNQFLWNPSRDATYLEQQVSWNESTQELLSRNLTKKEIGKTADWLMVTNPLDDTTLRGLLERHMETDTLATSIAEAVDLDNPCDSAASNIEVYLLMFGIAVAACGGVPAVVMSVHQFIYWCRYMVRGDAERPSSVNGLKRLLPTYELLLAFFACTIFFILFAPVYAQMITEREVANYRKSSARAQVLYAIEKEEALYLDRPTLIPMAYTETKCEDARPDLLFAMFVLGLAFALMINGPFLWRVYHALTRYGARLCRDEDEIPPGCTIADQTLRLLAGPFMESKDDDSDSSSSSSTKSLLGPRGNPSKIPTTRTSHTSSQGRSSLQGYAPNQSQNLSIHQSPATQSQAEGSDSVKRASAFGDVEESKQVVYTGVIFRKEEGSIYMSRDGLSFMLPDDKLIYRVGWSNVLKVKLSKSASSLAKMKLVVDDGGLDERHIMFVVPDRAMLEKLRDDVAGHINSSKYRGVMDPTEGTLSSVDFSSVQLSP